jgi:ATP-dependent Zn protease
MLLLTEKRHILEQVSSMLLAKEVLEGEEFDAIVQSDKAAVA